MDTPLAPTRLSSARRLRPDAVAAGCYLLLAFALTARLWRHPTGLMVAGNPNDTDLLTWWLSWTADALVGGDFTLTVQAMNAPSGVSAMWNPALLLPGIVLAPVTLIAGAQASYNVLVLLGFAGSAFTAFLLLRRHTDAAMWPAVAGGALYGFSPAMVHVSVGHLQLLLAPLVPLLVSASLDLLHRRVTVQRGGVRLGLLAAAQLFTGEELLYDTVLVVALLVIVLALSRPQLARQRIGFVTRGLAVATVIGGLVAGYPVWVQLHGPLAQQGSAFVADFYKADLSGFVTPSRMMVLHSAESAAAADRYSGGVPEYLAYLGWPLLAVIAVAVVAGWRDLQLRVSALLTVLLAALSLGATVVYQGNPTSIPGPWRLLQHLPLAESVLATRFGLFAPMAAGAVVAIVLTRVHSRWSPLAAAAVAAVLLAPLLPRPLQVEAVAITPESTMRALATVPTGDTVLVVPFPTATQTAPLRWQVDAGFGYRMPGGYFTGPGPDGHAYIGGDAPRATEALLTEVLDTQVEFGITAEDRAAATADLAYWGVDTVVLGPSQDSAVLERTLTALFGSPTSVYGGTVIWRDVGSG